MRTLVSVALLAGLLVPQVASAQEKIPITEKILLTVAPLTEDSATPELQKEYGEFAKALETELKAQAASFNADCQWNIVVKVLVKPKSKVIEVTLEPRPPLAPRLFTNAFPRRASFENDEAFKESFKGLVKTIITRTATCTS